MVALPVDLRETDGLRRYSFIHQSGSWQATDAAFKGVVGGGLMKKLLTKVQEGLRVPPTFVIKQSRNNNEGNYYHPGPDGTRVESGCQTQIKSQL